MTDVALEIDESAEESNQQYVTFQIGKEDFGFPMSQVAEIIRLPLTVGVPLTPDSLLGLANLRGNILPVLDLRHILQLGAIDHGEATRVIVADAGRPVGLVVDRVAKVITADENQMESAEGLQTTTDSKLLTSVIRTEDKLIQLMDVQQLIRQEFERVLADVDERITGNHSQYADQLNTSSESSEEDDTTQLVSFSVDSQEYAFDLMEVEEIVRVPENIARLPTSDQHVLGLINLRGRLLPLVSLRRMFELPEQELDEQHRVLVIGLGMTDKRIPVSVGIVVDEVKEVLSVAMELRDEVSVLLSKGGDLDEISAVCRLQEGKRLVSILSSRAMFRHPAIQSALAVSEEENVNMNNAMDELDNSDIDQEEEDTQMVVFKLSEQEYGVTIEDVQEITRVPDEMNKVPKTADFIDGMVNLRGTVLPVLDMRTRFGIERMERNDRQRILVLNLNGMRTGFIMDSVVEVLRLNRSKIEVAPDLSEDQSRVMGRVVNLREEKRMIQVLDVHELLSKQEIASLVDEE